MIRRWALDAAALLVGVVVAACAGELLLRAFWPQRSDVTLGMFEQDPVAGYRLRGDYRNEVRVPEYRTTILTDAEGYRVVSREKEARPGAARLLAVGDSFTFGVGVNAENAFPALLERRLNTPDAGAWEVRNGGVGGYGPLRSARLLVERQAQWRPDVVVYALYVGNDLEDSNPATVLTNPVVRDGRMVTEGGHALLRLRLFLRTHSHLYAFLRQHLYGLYRASGLWERSQYLDPMGLKTWPPRLTELTWPAGQEAIRSMRDWAAENGVHFLVVVVPTRWQVDDAAWARYRREWHLPDGAFERDHAQRDVLATLQRMEIPALNLLPAYRRAQAGGIQTYYRMDPHWTAAGHALCAQLLQLDLTERGWVGPRAASSRAIVRAPGAQSAG